MKLSKQALLCQQQIAGCLHIVLALLPFSSCRVLRRHEETLLLLHTSLRQIHALSDWSVPCAISRAEVGELFFAAAV